MSKTITDWDKLRTLTSSELVNLGFGCYNKTPDKDGKILMLIPGDLHKSIPKGYEVESIFGDKKVCNPSATYSDPGYIDDDIRFGYLAYGIRTLLG